MSSRIQELLAQIASAVRGAEVRSAIHDAIAECYDDVSTAKTAADASVTAANAAATEASDKAALAQAKANLAEQKATLADTAAQNADTKATLADTAANSVSSVIAACQTAIANAESATTNTQTAITNANAKAALAEQKANAANAAAEEAVAAAAAAAAAAGSGSIVIDPQLDTSSTNAVQNRVIKNAIDSLQQQIDALNYEPIRITAFSVAPAEALIGRTVSEVTLSWMLNKEATNATLDGESVSLSGTSGTMVLSSLSLTADKTWTLVVSDGTGSGNKTVALRFLNNIYYGAAAQPANVNEAFVKVLANKPLSGSRARTFSAAAGSGEYIWYAVPTRLGLCSFTVGGFSGGFDIAVSSLSITNEAGYAETYIVYRSTNAGLGSTAVSVS